MAISLDNWLALYSPSRIPGLLAVRPDPNPKIADLFRFETAVQTVASAALIGDAVLEAQQADIALQQARLQSGGSCNDDEIQKWLDAPSTGLTTLLDMSRTSSGWQPLVDTPENVGRFHSYLQIVEACPLLHLEFADQATYHRATTDWNRVIDDIVGFFTGVESADLAKIKKSLVDLADAATSRHNTRQAENIFTDQVPQKDRDALHHNIYFSHVELVVDSHGKSTTNQVDYTINRMRFEFRSDLWERATALAVCQRFFCSLDDWLIKNKTTKGDIHNPQPVVAGYR